MTEPKRLTPTQIYIRVATIIALPLALVALIPAAYATYRVWQVADEANARSLETRQATCSFVKDLQQRYDVTAAYIKAVEDHDIPGFAFPGQSLSDLKATQSTRKATLDSFSDLNCTGEEGK